MKKFFLCSFLCLMVCLTTAMAFGQQSTQKGQPRDKVKATKIIKGYVKGFEVGDYTHAVIKKETGGETSFFLNESDALRYFLVSHKGQLLQLTYQVVDSFIPEAGGVQTIERLVAAKAGDLTHQAWWKRESARSSPQRLRRKYDALIEKSIVNQ